MTDPAEICVTPQELAARLASANPPIVIDVRDPEEFAATHIENARNVPLTNVAPLFDDPASAEAMVFVCESGVRSMQAAQFAKLAGLTAVHSLEGGMVAWNSDGNDE